MLQIYRHNEFIKVITGIKDKGLHKCLVLNLAVYNLYSTFNKYKFLLYIDEPASNCVGKIYAVIERENDVEDKLIVVTDNKEYSIEEIKKNIYFQEKNFNYRIVK